MNTIFSDITTSSFDNQASSNTNYSEESEDSFQTVLDETKSEEKDEIEEKKERKETIQNLLDDVRYIVNTGLTKSEIEHINELTKKINDAIKEAAENGSSSYDIQSMIKNLQDMVESITKRITGRFIKEDSNTSDSSNNNESYENQELQNLSSNLEELQNTFNNLQNGYQSNNLEAFSYRRTDWETELKKYQMMFT